MLAEYLGRGLTAAREEIQMEGEWVCSKVARRVMQWLLETGCLCGVLDFACLAEFLCRNFKKQRSKK